ncbi:Hypothetical predicted protein [Mytilus galloprovincialis]|uniref:G-protein coupled receptors family 1 profile domain-containing protein n=1 Tax=Mytilus galloprovincialis TaxID=29158 RepID=A0A8B6GHC6_MYTGA|nr:Hypothetical predicted protein [Mytilus galloprovincialis]
MLFTLYARSPFWMNMVAGPTSAYLSIVMNIIVFVALFDKKIKTPSTVIMQGLALADGFTALCTYGLEPLFATKYEQVGIPGKANLIDMYGPSMSIEETKELVYLQFPYCLLHYCLTNLADTFHLISILLTMFLGVQKLLAVACPIWSRTKMTVIGSMIVCGMCFMFSFVLNIPRILVVSLSEGTEGTCLISKPNEMIEKYVLTYYPILFTIILTIAVMAMLASTCYIIVILCRRKYIRGHAKASKSEKKSCTLIVCVMIVFLLSEIPRLSLNASVFHTFRSDVDKDNMALYRVGKEVEIKSFSCLTGIAKTLVEKAKVQQNMSIKSDESCVTGLMDLPQYWRELTHEFMSITEKCFILDALRDKIKPSYYREYCHMYMERS